MKYLFIDTSTHDLTVSISTDEKIISMATLSTTNEHSKYALVELKEAFAIAGLKPKDINKIMVTSGPGSFTGVRIGITIAKTYAWSLNKDIVPISSLLTYALGYSGYDYYISVLDARHGHAYVAIYDASYNEVLKEQYMDTDNLKKFVDDLKGNVIVTGDIKIEGYETNKINIDILKIVNHFKNYKPINPHAVNPHYLKRVEAEEKLMGVEG